MQAQKGITNYVKKIMFNQLGNYNLVNGSSMKFLTSISLKQIN